MDRPLKALSGWHIVILVLVAASCGADAAPNQHKAGATRFPGLSCMTGGLRLRGGNSQFWLPGQGGGASASSPTSSELQSRIKMLEELRDETTRDMSDRVKMLDEMIKEMKKKMASQPAAKPATGPTTGPTTRPPAAAPAASSSPAPAAAAASSPPKKGFFRVVRSLSEQAINEEHQA